MAVLQNHSNNDTNKNLRSSLDRIEVMKDDTITGDFDVEQTGSVSEDNNAEEEERTDSQVFEILQDKEIEVNQDKNDIEDFEFEPIVSVCQDDNIEEEKRDGQKLRVARKTDKKINEKQRKRLSDEYQRASDSEKSILEQDIDSERVVTRKYLEEELGALGRVIVERITEELDAKISSNRSESIRTTTNVSEFDQNIVDNQIIIDGISINSHCWYLAANAKTMRKRANHIMRGCWTEEERNILVLRRNKRYDDGRVVKSRELENIKTLCLNLQSAKKLKYKKGKHNIEANLRDWLKDFLKNDRYRRSQLVYNDEDL
ncbi:uncharacterized protein LOC122860530 [Aphidius gifuensis]|nr:uncharacterized protein LOC122860530 [Aphidius gifuensis]